MVIVTLQAVGISNMKATIISVGVLATILVWIAVIGAIKVVGPQEAEFSGLLSPANEPTPPNQCGKIPDNAILLLLGNSASYTSRSSQTVIQLKGDNVLSVEKDNGNIAVNATVFSRDGRIVADIRRNEFSINPNNFFRKERPDTHTLIVYDQENRKVLDVSYLNSRTIKFSGILNHPQMELVISGDSGIFKNSVCVVESSISFAFG